MEFLLHTINNNLMLSQYIPFHHNDHISKYQCSFYYLVYVYVEGLAGGNNNFILPSPSDLHHSCCSTCTMPLSSWYAFYKISFVFCYKVLPVRPGFYWYFYTFQKLPLCSVAISTFHTISRDMLPEDRLLFVLLSY